MTARHVLLLDALGTLLALEPPAPRLRSSLRRHAGIELSDAEAGRAIAAEIAYYRAHLGDGRDRESLAALRLRCAEVMRAALPVEARATDLDVVLISLLDALEFCRFPDAIPAILAARGRGQKVVVVSNWDISLGEVLSRLELARLLDGVVVSASVGVAKPAPEIFERALALAGATAAHAMHVGDRVVEDVEGARAVGIEPILLRRDGGSGPPGVQTIHSLDELARLPGRGA